jgi:hypothetical protein
LCKRYSNTPPDNLINAGKISLNYPRAILTSDRKFFVKGADTFVTT